jgi:UDP-glucose:(heptosyl)LPS alpha-1,3-glucosyltransferase
VPNAARYLLARHLTLLALERSYFRSGSGAVVAVSDEVASDLVELYGVSRDRIAVIPNGFDEAQCSPERRRTERSAERAAWQIGDGALAMLFVANELHRKGFDCLLEAVALTGDPSMEIHVVGRAPIEPYAARIAELGLHERVRYHGAVDIGLAHAAADALVLPTQYEAFALTVVEALASGLPVVTTSVPGAGDRITDGVNGLLQHDPSDATELARLLAQVSDAGTRERLGAAGPASVADLEWDRLAARLDAVIQGSRESR